MNNKSVQSWADATQSRNMAKFRKQWAATPKYNTKPLAFQKPVRSNCFDALEA